MPPPRGAVALAFTDIEGSSRLWERLGDRFAPILARHHALLRTALAAADGHEVKTEGDSFMIAFPSAARAVTFALAAQEALSRERWPEETGELRVRMGIHVGAPIVVEEADGRIDYLGPVVNRAARVASAAHGGQVLLSAAARDAASDALGAACVADLGEHRLKGLEGTERLWQALPRSLASRTFPPPATVAVRPTNLPEPVTAFVGREREVDALGALFAAPAPRLVTISGPGGTGKTRLAQRVGAELLDRFPGGVWFADLAEARDGAGIAHAVAGALGAPLSTALPSVRQVGAMLGFRPPMLLILDNFEQVVAAAAETAGEWLARAPGLRILATSRFLLGIAGEQEFPLEPLPCPPRHAPAASPAEFADFAAVRLFLDRAREARPEFALTAANAPEIATLCAELDGMPLALELAAARLRVLSVADIVARLGDRFRLLASTRRDLTTRQRSLQGAVEWSWSLLAPWEQGAFAQLCAFRSGFFLEDAEAVLDLQSFPGAPAPADAVQALCEKSFLHAWPTPFGKRFGIYLTLHAWGNDRAAAQPAHGGGAACRARVHARLTSRAEEWAAARGDTLIAALDRFDLERDNLLAVVAGALADGDPPTAARAALALERVLALRGPWDLRIPLLSSVHARLPGSPLQTRVAVELARAQIAAGRLPEAAVLLKSALAAARAQADAEALAETLRASASAEYAGGNTAASLALARELAVLAAAAGRPDWHLSSVVSASGARDATGDSAAAAADLAASLAAAPPDLPLDLRAWAEFSLGVLQSSLGQPARAAELGESAARHWKRLGCAHLVARALAMVSRQRLRLGDAAASLAGLEAALAVLRRSGDVHASAWTLLNCAEVLKRLGRFDEALARAGESEAIARQAGLRRELQDALSERGFILLRIPRLDAAESVLREAEALAVELKEPGRLARVQTALARVLQGRGNLAGALELVRAALATYQDTGNRSNAGAVSGALASLLLALRRFPEAIVAAETGIRLYAETGERNFDLPITEMKLAALLELGRAAEAEALATETLQRPDVARPEFFEHRCGFQLRLAEALRALGRRDDARAAERAALEDWRRWEGPVPPELARRLEAVAGNDAGG